MGNPQEFSYGQAGGKGQGFTRFQIAGDPSPFFPVWSAGTMRSNLPSQLMEARGGAYRWGRGLVIGGVKNMFTDGDVLRPLMAIGETLGGGGVIQALLGGTGAGNYDAIVNARHQYCYSAPNNTQIIASGIVVNGEFVFQDTTTAANHYGAAKEGFTFAASTVTANNTSTLVTATLANAFTSAATLTGPYGTAPSFNAPRRGDLIEIVEAGVSRFFRIANIPTATTLRIFPAYNAPGGAGLTYRLWRTGYGSWSHLVQLYENNARWGYYAGNTTTNQFLSATGGAGFGTVQAIHFDGSNAHFMAPKTVDELGNPVTDLRAVDVAYFKSFLLYGFGNTIGWSIPGFPGAAFPFDPLCFPAANIAAIDTRGEFLYFEQVGDQLLAFFEDAIFLVSATGVVPEFTVYSLPVTAGVILSGITDPQSADGLGNSPGVAYTRSSIAGGGTVFFINEEGLQQMSGLTPKRISIPIENFAWNGDDNFMLNYDRGLNALVWSDCTNNRSLGFQPEFDHWFQLNTEEEGVTRGLASVSAINAIGMPGRTYRQPTLAYWRASDQKIYVFRQGHLDDDSSATSRISWLLATPVISLGDIYDGLQFGGLRIMARAAAGTSNNSLFWQVFESSNPYAMVQADSGNFIYDDAMADSSKIVGRKCDGAFIGVVLSGTKFVELAAVGIYPSGTTSRR